MARQWQASSSCSIASGNLSHAACLPPVSSVVILLPVCLIVMTVPGGKIFGGVESWVDTSKAAGCTSQVEQLGLENTIRQIVTLKYFFYSPNLVWFILAFVIYAVAPYDIPAARIWSWSWISAKAFLELCGCFCLLWLLLLRPLHQPLVQQEVFPRESFPLRAIWRTTCTIGSFAAFFPLRQYAWIPNRRMVLR